VAQERLVPVRYYGGLSLSADHVLDGILPHLGEPGESGALPKGTAERPATTNGDDAGDTGAAKPKVGAS
jgi:hypothetical protein